MSFTRSPLSQEQSLYREQGGNGPKPITGTSEVTGNFYEICAGGSGCTIDAITITGKSDSWSGFVLAAGECLKAGSGRLITAITLSAGTAFGYEDAT